MKTLTPSSAAELYARLGLRCVPRLLALADRNPLSPTYGCFDRQYWHYRTADFACGMNQEFGLPLALAFAADIPGNRWRSEPRLRELALAAVTFARRSAHRDGSCDDYYPFERALGATCFALYACALSCRLLGCREPALLEHLAHRARFVAKHHETGRLGNHQALAALALFTVSRLTQAAEFEEAARSRAEGLLAWQDAEGWFVEYEGCDPGYHAFCIDFLAKLKDASGWEFLDEPLERAVRFARDFLHPDGSYGGEYGSRDTFNYMPHGFELLGDRSAEARQVADGWLWGAQRGLDAANDDDRIFVHPAFSRLQAAWTLAERGDRPLPQEPPAASPGVRHYPNAGLLVVHRGEWHLVIALRKGGVFKAWRGQTLEASDTGLVGAPGSGRRLLVSHLDLASRRASAGVRIEVEPQRHRARVVTPLAWVKPRLPSPLRQALFRAATCTVGRFAPHAVRAVLQRLLITGRRLAPFTLEREFDWGSDPPVVTDTLRAGSGAPALKALYRSTDATSLYTATSNAAQPGALMPWTDLSGMVAGLREAGVAVVGRSLGR